MVRCPAILRLPVIPLIVLASGLDPAVVKANVFDGVGAAVGVAVKAKIPIPNNTDQVANDLHFYIFQKDRAGVTVNGADLSHVGPFTLSAMALRPGNGTPNPPPGMHGCEVTLSGGNVPPGTSVIVDMTLFLSAQNALLVNDIYWTFNGIRIPGPLPPPKAGFRVERPFKGVMDPEFHHIVCIENSTDEPTELLEVKLYPSMIAYSDPATQIDWGGVEPLQNEEIPPEPPVTIAAHGRWCYAAHLPGPSYVDGHVYLKYTLGDGKGRDTAMVFGDHPVDALCDDPACMGHELPPVGRCILADASCISELYEFDCVENLDGFWLQGRTCQQTSDVPVDGEERESRFFRLRAANVNPFRSQVTVEYTLPCALPVEVAIFDITGRRVATLNNGRMDAGRHTVGWPGIDGTGIRCPAGDYFCRLRSGGKTATVKLVLLPIR